MPEPIMSIKNLCKDYGTFALRDVTIELPQGSIMGFIGRNGAGKSTTIKSILNIIPFDSGKITIAGMDNQKNEIQVKQIIGYVGEHLNIYEEVSGQQFYKFVKKFYEQWDDEFFAHLIKVFELDLAKKIGALSKGTALKFALSLALSHHPKLLILDEPTSGLDPVIRNEVLEILKDIVNTENCSVFFSSHITEDIVKIADYVTCINEGQVILSEGKTKMLKNYKKLEFSEEIPKHLRQRLAMYRDKTAIVTNDELESLYSAGLPDNQVTCSPALLDEILLLLIKENTANVAANC
ncbi:MAG: ABC transporter ATP-binding protein [Thermoleophilia bacterium]